MMLLVPLMTHVLATLALAWGAPLPWEWECFGICMIVGGWFAGCCIQIYYELAG